MSGEIVSNVGGVRSGAWSALGDGGGYAAAPGNPCRGRGGGGGKAGEDGSNFGNERMTCKGGHRGAFVG